VPTTLPLRRVRDDDDDLLAFVRAVTRHFHEDSSEEDLRHWVPVIRDCAAFVVEDGDRIVGNYANLDVDVSLPGGGRLSCAGVTAVGVSQTHRRRGVLRAMMRAGLDEAREREQPVAALYASESPIYPRFGFGLAAPMQGYRIDTPRLRFRDPVDPHLVVDLDPAHAAAEATAITTVVGDRRPGLVSRSPGEWRLSVELDPPSFRDGASARRLVQVPGRGLAIYRIKESFTGEVPTGEVRLSLLVATDGEAEQALWQHVTDIDLTTTVSTRLRPLDDALPWMVHDRLRLGAGECSPLYVRLLDVARCLASRTSSVSDGVVLEVHDHDRDQSGRYRWDVSPEGSACSRTDAEPDVTLTVEALAAVWLGGSSPSQLRSARRLEERTDGAVARLGRMTATSSAPWTPWEF
jgi:predicted acetyltransferase